MKRRVVLVLLGIQALLVGAYLAVDRGRAPSAAFAVEALDRPAPALVGVDLGEDRVLVHFWATWCAPCREELPGLLQASRASGVRLVAVTDEEVGVVAAFFEGAVPPEVRLDPEARQAFGVSGLPDTFVVQQGRIVARMGGARDWSTRQARRYLRR